MARHEVVSDQLHDRGPVVRIRLRPCAAARRAMKRQGQKAASSIQVDALLDTGSSRSILREGLMEKLGIYPVGMVKMRTALKEQVSSHEFLLDVQLGKIKFGAVFIGAPMPDSDVQALIGRDILAHCKFTYRGKAKKFTLEF